MRKKLGVALTLFLVLSMGFGVAKAKDVGNGKGANNLKEGEKKGKPSFVQKEDKKDIEEPSGPPEFVKEEETEENGFTYDGTGWNMKAKLYKGFQGYFDRNKEGGWLGPNTMNSWLVAKFSRDWNFNNPEGSPVGAWNTQKYTWYTNEITVSKESLFGWTNREEWTVRNEIPDAKYKVEEFLKIKKLSPENSAEYIDNGAAPANFLVEFAGNPDDAPVWLKTTYEDTRIPKFVVIQDTVQVFDAESGELLFEVVRLKGPSAGLGN